MKKVFLITMLAILLLCPACTSNPDTSPSASMGPTSATATGESNTTSSDIPALRGRYFDFGIENRLDYVPFFDEGKAPSSSAEYLFYAFAVNLENWGDDKGIMTRDYVEQVIRAHFEIKDIKHTPLRKAWDYDGGKYTAVPQGIKEKPIYVLQKINTHTQDGRTLYEIKLDYCSFGGVLPTDEDMANIRASMVSGDLSALTVLQTEWFQYYLDQTTGAVVFLSHTLAEEKTASIQPAETIDREPTTHAAVNNFGGVTMAVKEGTASSTGLTVEFKNDSSSQCIYGEHFWLERKINGSWYQVPIVIEGNYAFNDIGYDLASGGSGKWVVDWDWLYGGLEPGEYRIVKDLLDFRGPGEYDTYYLAAEFTIY